MHPRFLAALDNADPTDNGYVADCPICRDLLLIEPIGNTWTFACDGCCSHQELVAWIQITDLRVDPASSTRTWVALMLAPNPHIWAALLAGEPVADEALDPMWLARFRKAGVIT